MHHLLAFYSSIAASSTNSKINAVEDGLQTIVSNNFLLNDPVKVQRCYINGLGIVEARYNIPSMRSMTLPRIHPVDKAASPSNDPSVMHYGDYGPKIMAGEGISLECSTDATSGPLAAYGLLWVAKAFVPAPKGDCFTIKATASVVTTVGVWNRGSLSLENDLPPGKYAVIGADAQGTNLEALRFRFPGQDVLPGVVTQQADGEFLTDHQRFGQMGLFGVFGNITLPTIEVFGYGTTTTQTIYLDVVKVG